MKKLLSLFILILCVFVTKKSLSQDIHFSQYYASPLTLNPALTGNYTGDWRVMGIYRSQWKSINIPYVTQGVGFDHQWYIYTENFSWGVNYINDNSGNINLTAHQLYGSFAWHKKLSNFHSFHAGLQVGYVFKNYSLSGQTYPEQWDWTLGQYNASLPSNEPLSADQPNYLDINLGAMWSKKYKILEPKIGVALYHLNQPKVSYLSSNNTMPSRQVFHGELKIDVSRKVYITPRALFMHMQNVNDLVAGANIGYYLTKNVYKLNSLWVGSYVRNGYDRNMDAVFFVAGLNYNNFDFGFSYDLNLSELKTATNHRGAFEISIIYTAGSTISDKNAMPCDRY